MFREYLQFIDEVSVACVRYVRKRPAILFALGGVYFGVVGKFLVEKTELGHELQRSFLFKNQQTEDLNATIEKQQAIIDALTKRDKPALFLKPLEFREQWQSDANRVAVVRILDYADFAIQKNDYSRAEKLYEEAAGIQNTLSIPYYLGRLAYIQGDLVEAERYWTKVIGMDKEDRYPEIRLYLGIALYEMGRERDCKDVLKDYLATKEKN